MTYFFRILAILHGMSALFFIVLGARLGNPTCLLMAALYAGMGLWLERIHRQEAGRFARIADEINRIFNDKETPQ